MHYAAASTAASAQPVAIPAAPVEAEPLEAARQGVGLGFVFRQLAEDSVRRGELLPLLERRSAPADTFHLYFPHRVRMPGKLRAFIDFMQEKNRDRQTS